MKYNKLGFHFAGGALVVFILLVSCSHNMKQSSILQRADSLMWIQPDSALYVLESTTLAEMKTTADSAGYALLMTQAKDKNYIAHTNDSLIRIAVKYNDNTKNVALKAKSHYYLGRVYQDMGETASAVREFLTAMALLQESKDYQIKCMLQANLGKIYFEQGWYDKADSLYACAVQLAVQRNDSAHWALALSWRGAVCASKGENAFPDAEKYLLQALDIAKGIDKVRTKDDIMGMLIFLYNSIEKPSKALTLAKQRLELQGSTARYSSGAYGLLGDAYYILGKYDSSAICLNKSLLLDNYGAKDYNTKAGTYIRLSEIARKQGKLEDALRYRDYYRIYLDSFELSQETASVVGSEKDFFVRQHKHENDSSTYRCQWCLIILFVALILLIVGYYLYDQKRFRKKTKFLRNERDTLQHNITERLKSTEMELVQKGEEVERLRLQLFEKIQEIEMSARD